MTDDFHLNRSCSTYIATRPYSNIHRMINYNQYFKFLSGLILFAITLFEVADIVDNRFGVEGHYTLLIVAIVSVFFVGTVKEDKFFFFVQVTMFHVKI